MAKETITAARDKFHDQANENRINKLFQKFDIVFIWDFQKIPGASRPLKTKFSPSPFFVVKVFHTTLLIQRLADNFRMLISMNHCKKYNGLDNEFTHLPPEIKDILINNFSELHPEDFNTILKLDPLSIPEGIELGDNLGESDSEDEDDSSQPPIDKSAVSLKGKGKGKGRSNKQIPINIQENHEEADQLNNTDIDPVPSTSQANNDLQDEPSSSDEEEDAMIRRGEKRVRFED